jgi:unsaturated chondroitin disaccharide hydrolase
LEVLCVSDQLVSSLLARVDETLEATDGRFPVYADPASGQWQATEDPEWNGGFWPGLLWLTAAATGETRYAEAAGACLAPLRAHTETTTILRGFMFWYGAALGFRLGLAGEGVTEPAVAAARSLAESFVPAAGVLSPGPQDARLYEWPSPGACVDGLPGTVPLLALASAQTGDPALAGMAVQYASGIGVLCVRPGGSLSQAATYDEAGALATQISPNASSDRATWGRAQAWGMLGLAQAAQLSDKLTPLAAEVADWYLANVPADRVCLWEFHPADPDTPQDTSATAIAAAALVKLAPLAGQHYRAAAAETLDALAGHLCRHGGLVDGCYNAREGRAPRHELIWGDYFALEAALALAGTIDPALL